MTFYPNALSSTPIIVSSISPAVLSQYRIAFAILVPTPGATAPEYSENPLGLSAPDHMHIASQPSLNINVSCPFSLIFLAVCSDILFLISISVFA